MKKLTVLFPDNVRLSDFEDVIAECIEFHLETIPDPVDMKKKKLKRHINKIPGTTIRGTLTEHYVAGGMFTKETAAKWLTAKGYAPSSASPAISTLIRTGFLEPIGNQKYKWIKSPT